MRGFPPHKNAACGYPKISAFTSLYVLVQDVSRKRLSALLNWCMKPAVGAIHEFPLPQVLVIGKNSYHTCIQQRQIVDPSEDDRDLEPDLAEEIATASIGSTTTTDWKDAEALAAAVGCRSRQLVPRREDRSPKFPHFAARWLKAVGF